MDQIVVPRSLGDRLIIASSLLSIGTVLYIVGLCIYRLCFHPLAKFPGPWINAVSDVNCLLTHDKHRPITLADSWCDMDSSRPNAHEYENTS
jgi:hypothetical protein